MHTRIHTHQTRAITYTQKRIRTRVIGSCKKVTTSEKYPKNTNLIFFLEHQRLDTT